MICKTVVGVQTRTKREARSLFGGAARRELSCFDCDRRPDNQPEREAALAFNFNTINLKCEITNRYGMNPYDTIINMIVQLILLKPVINY